MLKIIMKFVLSIFLFLIPITGAVGLMRLANDKSAYVPTKAYVQYFSEYPENNIENLKISFSNINNVGFADNKPNFNPDFSGNIFEDVKEVVEEGFDYLGTIFGNIFDYIQWFFEVLYLVMKLIIDTVVWAFNIIPYVINY